MRNRRTILGRTATVVAAAAAAVALTATPAFAGSDLMITSWHYDCGNVTCVGWEAARAYFYHDGDDWKVCDMEADGYRAKMSVTWTDSGGDVNTLYTENTNGAGTCVTGGVGINIPEGNRVKVEVWHQDGATGSRQDVTTGYTTA